VDDSRRVGIEVPRTVERLLAEREATRELLRALARGAGLPSLLDEVVRAAQRLCDGDHGQLYLRDGGVFFVRSESGGQKAALEYSREHPHEIDRTTVVGRVALSGEAVQIPDVLTDPDYDYGAQAIVGFRALLGVPITLDGELIGALAVGRNQPGPFGDEQVGLVLAFADQAAVAIANARLLETVERQLEQQRAIAELLRGVARSEGLDAVFGVALEAAMRLCDCDYGALYMVEGELVRSVIQHGGSPEHAEYERNHPHTKDRHTLVGRVAVTERTVHIPDTLADPEYSWPGQEMSGYRAMLGVPILVERELIGVFGLVRNEPKPFTDEQTELVETFADQAAIAIANARLLEAVERQRSELARFVSPQVAELISSPDGERLLHGHRAYISCLFCDLRNFTGFAETAAPEELIELLGDYHTALGELIPLYHGTLEHFAGDGVMVFFNDPLSVPDHELEAVRLALAVRERFEQLADLWRKRGTELALGIGIEAGYATLGRIGFEGRYDYGALGPVTNLAARLSTQAAPHQILIGPRIYAALEDTIEASPVGEVQLKGFARPISTYQVQRVLPD
jgi:adenylate cyclase